jgi:hypothetical protein
MALGGAANGSIITLGRQESSNEDGDRTWRRWVGFQSSIGFTGDPFLSGLSFNEQSLLAKAFLQALRTLKWTPTGSPDGLRPRPVVANTVRQATSILGAAFRGNFQQSPFHNPNAPNLRPVIRSLMQAYTNADPSTKRQRAITPKLLRGMYSLSGAQLPESRDSHFAIISEIAIVGFFFAMRSCECTSTPTPGRTKIISLQGVIFRNVSNQVIQHHDPDLSQAHYVTLTFQNQKNGCKDDKRTHTRSGDDVLCPVIQLASLVQRIHRLFPNAEPTTTINTTLAGDRTVLLPSTLLLKHLRSSCSLLGGFETFGFRPLDLGTRSIRSGAAMGLFLMNHSVTKIMLMGRWSSDAFLNYIRPQVLEWTNQLSADMIHNNSYFDVTDPRRDPPDTPRTQRRRSTVNNTGTLALHLHH